MLELNLGDLLRLKKQHPCGSETWLVVRTGADIRIQCTGCQRLVMLERRTLEKRVKEVVSRGNPPGSPA